MTPYFKKFLFQTGIISLIFLIGWLVLRFTVKGNWLSPAIPFLVPFFFVITAGVYYFMLRSAANRFSRFINSFMMLTFVKIIIFAVIIIVYALQNKADAYPFTAAFLIFYLIYTVCEVAAFLRDTRKMEKK
jgi:hypothetical protein